MARPLTVAVAKGRLLEQSLPLLAAAGVELPVPAAGTGAALCLDSADGAHRLLVVRGADVATYVQLGAAQLGVIGSDMLLEHIAADSGAGLCELLDLGIARCRLVRAARVDVDQAPPGLRRVASKYIAVARRFYAERGIQAQLIKLHGSMELAPLCGLVHEIVDITDTGATLARHELQVVEEIACVSARLVVNKAALRVDTEAVESLCERLAEAVGGAGD